MKPIWTKTYKLNHKRGSFSIFISLHSTDYYYGCVLYYNKTGNWANGEVIDLKFELEQFIDKSEESVYNMCVKWVDENLGTDYSIQLEEHKEF